MDFVRKGDWDGALSFFARSLEASKDGVGKPLRAVRDLLKWHASRDPEAVKNLNWLCVGESPQSVLMQAAAHVRHAAAVETVTADITNLDGYSPRPASGGGADKQANVSPSFKTLSDLGRALVRVCQTGDDAERRACEALLLLPASDQVPPSLFPVYARVRVWAAITGRQYEQVYFDQAVWRALPAADARRAKIACAFGAGQVAVFEGRINDARRLLNDLGEFEHPTLRASAIVEWGLRALAWGAPAAAADWFAAEQRDSTEPVPVRQALALGDALARWQEGDTTRAREAFEALASDDSNPSDATAQAACLCALAMIAAAVQGETKTSVEGRALWNDLLRRVEQMLARLDHASSDIQWRRDLIRGLIEWAGRESAPTPESLARFAAAIGAAHHGQASERLRAIEGELISKARAIDESLSLVARRDVVRLRELHATLLAELGEAIPPTVRALVAMTIWQSDPSFDPLPELVAQLARGDAGGLFEQAIAQVQAAQTMAKLRQLCLSPEDMSALPALGPLSAVDAQAGARAALASALITLRRGDLPQFRSMLSAATAETDPVLPVIVRMVGQWQSGEPGAFRDTLQSLSGNSHPIVRHGESHHPGIAAACLLHALRAVDEDGVAEFLDQIGWRENDDESISLLCCVVNWLVKSGQADHAAVLVRLAARRAGQPRLAFACAVLAVMVAGGQRQFASVVNLADQAARMPCPQQPAFGSPEADQMMSNWCALFRLEAQLAALSAANEDVRARWPSARRALLDESARMHGVKGTGSYADLLAGLLSHLAIDAAVEDSILANLAAANRALPITRGAQFVGNVLTRFDERQRVLAQFWSFLRAHKHGEVASIYRDEVKVLFAGQQPKTMVMADILSRCVNGVAPGQLEDELKALTPGLGGGLAECAKVLALHLRDARQVSQLIELMRARRWEDVARLADSFQWTGVNEGSMPLPVAVLLLLARYQCGQADKARALAEQLTNGRFADWLNDDAALLLGYTFFDREQFQEAARAFSKAKTGIVLGHDVERYGAAANFNAGIVLMKADQKAAAFDAFAMAMGQRRGDAENARLAPLFLHFGLTGIETRQGDRARKAFHLLKEGLDDAEIDAEGGWFYKLARMGELLCDSLMEEDVERLGGEVFLKLAADVEVPEGEDGSFAIAFKRCAVVLGTCQELRREVRRQAKRRQSVKAVHDFIETRASELDELPLPLDKGTKDPLLPVLRGTARLSFDGRTNPIESINLLERATRAGVQSRKLADFLERHKKDIKEARQSAFSYLDRLDAWLASGHVPDWAKGRAAASDDIRQIYKLARQCTPADVTIPGGSDATKALLDRVERLLQFATEGSRGDNKQLKKLVEALKARADKFADMEGTIVTAEAEIYESLAGMLRAEALK